MTIKGKKFYVHTKANKDGSVKIYLRYKIAGKYCKYYLRTKIFEKFKSYFDKSQDPPMYLKNEVKKLFPERSYLVDDCVSKALKEAELITNIFFEFENANENIPENWTKERFVNYLNSRHKRKELAPSITIKFTKYIDDTIKKMENGKLLTNHGRIYKEGTIIKYRQLSSLLKTHFGNRDIRLADINPDLVNDFLIGYLHKKKKFAPETIRKHKMSLLMIINNAIREKLLKPDVLGGTLYKPDIKENEFLALTFEELERLWAVKVPLDRSLGKSQELFKVLCYTAQSIGDVFNMKKEDIIEKNGRYFWRIERSKTYISVDLLLKPVVYEIMKKHNFNLRIIASTTLLLKLKELGEMAGLNEEITLFQRNKYQTKKKYKFIVSHSGRRTMLNQMLNEGYTLKEIQAIANHSSISVTEKYLQLDRKAFEEKMLGMPELN